MRLRAIVTGALLVAMAAEVSAQVPFTAVADSARVAPAAEQRIPYGSAPQQFAELRMPRGAGPHPVVFLVHGGCWLNQYGVDHVAGAAESLRAAGVAVFAVEYRRVGDAGAGDPGTFDDIRAAFATLRGIAPQHQLDLERVALMGHSAGGHLALWLAAEPDVRVRGVVSLAGVTDLAAFATPSGCGSAVARLLGGSPAAEPALYAALSPATRPAPPAGTRVLLIAAADDRIVPASQAATYAKAIPSARVETVPGGHFDLVAAWTPAWSRVLTLTTELLQPPGRE